MPASFDLLRIESDDYGPVQLAPRVLRDRKEPIRVARKATVAITLGDNTELIASLYPVDSHDFREPSHRIPLLRQTSGPAPEIKMPSGMVVVSLAREGAAPDLRVMMLRPGSRQTLSPIKRDGWSALIRVADRGGQPIDGALVEFSPLSDYTAARHAAIIQRATTGTEGLAVLNGLPAPLYRAAITHPARAAAMEAALSSSPGTFTFREVNLPKGGTIVAHVLVDGAPSTGAACRIQEEVDRVGLSDKALRGSEITTNASGSCRFEHVSPGLHELLVRPPKSSSSVRRSVDVIDELTIPVLVELRRTRVTGRVTTVGGDAIPDVTVEINRSPEPDEKHRAGILGNRSAKGLTDEDGIYEAFIWERGRHLFTISRNGTPGLLEFRYLDAGDEVVDFELSDKGVHGFVVDANGDIVQQATVKLVWRKLLNFTAYTDAEGAFRFPTAGAGTAEISAVKTGYRAAPPLTLEVPDVGLTQPAILTLTEGKLQGVVVGNDGIALPGVTVVAAMNTQDFLPITVSDTQGRFSLDPHLSLALFLTGPQCPLSLVRLPEHLPDGPITAPCAHYPASIVVLVNDELGKPVQNQRLSLRMNGIPIPDDVLRLHLAALNLPAATDFTGTQALPAVAPASYELFLDLAEEVVDQPYPPGLLGSVSPGPLETLEIAFTVKRSL